MRLTQVFANLLNNAAKYTPREGHIEISMKRDGDQASVSVRDNGMGISPEMLSEIFDLFAQSHRAMGREQGGIGVGLALVRSLLEMHGGQVEARSEGVGCGSEFVVRLPLVVTSSGAEKTEDETAVSSIRLCVVFWSSTIIGNIADALVMLLQALGCDVRTAYSGVAGLAAVAEFKPQLAFVDIGMPGMDGYETARQIRKLPEGKDLILAVLSGWGRDEDRRCATEAGFDHHFVKPIKFDALETCCARCRPTPEAAGSSIGLACTDGRVLTSAPSVRLWRILTVSGHPKSLQQRSRLKGVKNSNKSL